MRTQYFKFSDGLLQVYTFPARADKPKGYTEVRNLLSKGVGGFHLSLPNTFWMPEGYYQNCVYL